MRRLAQAIVPVAAATLVAMACVPRLFLRWSPGGVHPDRCSLRGSDGKLQHLLAPSRAHWLGTDAQGCDLLARTVFAARISIGIAAAAVLLATLVGTLLGAVAGFARGWPDAVIGRATEVFSGIPPIVFAILVLSTSDNRSLLLVSAVIAGVAVPPTAKIVRAAVQEQAVLEYVEAARASGAREARVLARHIGPNVVSTVVAFAMLGIGPAIAAETTLAFLGLSVNPPAAGWGVLIAEGQNRLTDRPYLLLVPGIMLIITMLNFVLLADMVDERMSPRRVRRRPRSQLRLGPRSSDDAAARNGEDPSFTP